MTVEKNKQYSLLRAVNKWLIIATHILVEVSYINKREEISRRRGQEKEAKVDDHILLSGTASQRFHISWLKKYKSIYLWIFIMILFIITVETHQSIYGSRTRLRLTTGPGTCLSQDFFKESFYLPGKHRGPGL